MYLVDFFKISCLYKYFKYDNTLVYFSLKKFYYPYIKIQ